MIIILTIFLILFFIQTVCFLFCTFLQIKGYLLAVKSDKELYNFRQWQMHVINEKRNKEYCKECE